MCDKCGIGEMEKDEFRHIYRCVCGAEVYFTGVVE